MQVKVISLVQCIMLGSVVAMAGEPTDTLVVVKNPSVVILKENSVGKTLMIQGNADDPDFTFGYQSTVDGKYKFEKVNTQILCTSPFTRLSKSNKGNMRFSTSCGCDFYAGGVIPLNGDLGMSRAGWQIGMLNVARAQWRLSSGGLNLSLGVGWQYSYLTIGDGMMGTRSAGGAYQLERIPADYSNVKTSLRNFAVQFPLLLSQRLSGRFAIEAGAVAMLNTYTTGNCSWTEGTTKSKLPLKNLHQRILTVDVVGRIGWKERFAVYVRYSPMQLFSTTYGPQYNPIAVGASLGF